MKRVTVGIEQAIWPFRILLGVTILLLTSWTALGGSYHFRKTIDESTGESIGVCRTDQSLPWLISVSTILGIATFSTIFVAWKTKDVDSAYAESSWIFSAITTQLQVLFVSIPVLIILNGQSSNARHLGISLVVFSFSMSISVLVMFPKFVAFYNNGGEQESRDGRRANQVPRGGRSGRNVVVTGTRSFPQSLESSDEEKLDSAIRDSGIFEEAPLRTTSWGNSIEEQPLPRAGSQQKLFS